MNQEMTIFVDDGTKLEDNFLVTSRMKLRHLSAQWFALLKLLKGDEKKKDISKKLLDSSKLMTDVHHTLSIHRRMLLSNHLDLALKKEHRWFCSRRMTLWNKFNS